MDTNSEEDISDLCSIFVFFSERGQFVVVCQLLAAEHDLSSTSVRRSVSVVCLLFSTVYHLPHDVSITDVALRFS